MVLLLRVASRAGASPFYVRVVLCGAVCVLFDWYSACAAMRSSSLPRRRPVAVPVGLASCMRLLVLVQFLVSLSSDFRPVPAALVSFSSVACSALWCLLAASRLLACCPTWFLGCVSYDEHAPCAQLGSAVAASRASLTRCAPGSVSRLPCSCAIPFLLASVSGVFPLRCLRDSCWCALLLLRSRPPAVVAQRACVTRCSLSLWRRRIVSVVVVQSCVRFAALFGRLLISLPCFVFSAAARSARLPAAV